MRRFTGLCIAVLLVVLVVPSFAQAADPDGAGPWADVVVATGPGGTADGGALDPRRRVPNAALGVAEQQPRPDRWPEYFISLGFGGNVTLGFENAICADASGQALELYESTSLPYPTEVADVWVSRDGVDFVQVAAAARAGRFALPPGMAYAKYVRLVDRSAVENFPDINADAYDLDGARALATGCSPSSPVTAGVTGSSDGGVLGASPRSCVKRKRLKVRVRIPKGFKVKRARVYVKGKRLAKRHYTLRNLRRRVATLRITKLPAGRFVVKVRLADAQGRKVVGKRRYRACGSRSRPIIQHKGR